MYRGILKCEIMKKILTFLLVALSVAAIVTLASCSKEDKVKEVVIEYLKSRAKDPASLEILSMEVLNDTLPVYLEGSLSTEIESLPKLYEQAQRPSFFYSQKSKQKKLLEVYDNINKILSERTNKKYTVALVEASGNNVLGGRSSMEIIVILDDNNDNVLAHFLARDYKKVVPIIYNEVYSETIPVNEFGNVEINNLPKIDGFILSSKD